MKIFHLNDVIVEREFDCRDTDGNLSAVKLYLGKPYLVEQIETQNEMWCCLRQIIGLGDEKVRPAYGADGMQALLLTLNIAEVELKTFAKSEQKTLTWLGGAELLSDKPSQDK